MSANTVIESFRKISKLIKELNREEQPEKIRAAFENYNHWTEWHLSAPDTQFYNSAEVNELLKEFERSLIDYKSSGEEQGIYESLADLTKFLSEDRRNDLAFNQGKTAHAIETFDSTLQKQEERFERLLDQIANRQEGKEASREEAFAEEQRKMSEHHYKYTETAQDIINGLQLQLDKAKEINGIVAGSAKAGEYKKVAIQECIVANIFRGLALVIFLVMLYFIWDLTSSFNANDFNFEFAAFRLAVISVFLIPAFYCAKEATKHQEAHNTNRCLGLEFAMIDTYLNRVDDPEAQKVIIDLSKKYFGNSGSDGSKDTKEKAFSSDDILMLLRKILNKD